MGEFDCEIRVSPRFTLVASSIHQALQVGRSPSLDHILNELNNQKDGVWRDFFNLVPPEDRPQNFRALGYLFYIFQVVRPALAINPRQCSPDGSSGSDFSGPSQPSSCFGDDVKTRSLLIYIDDGAERPIHSRAQKLFKKIRASCDILTCPTLVEMYLYPRVFINSNESGSNRYLDDSTPSEHSTILHSTGGGGGGGGDANTDSHPPSPSPLSAAELKPIDIVRVLYGVECAENLQMWLKEVGLQSRSNISWLFQNEQQNEQSKDPPSTTYRRQCPS